MRRDGEGSEAYHHDEGREADQNIHTRAHLVSHSISERKRPHLLVVVIVVVGSHQDRQRQEGKEQHRRHLQQLLTSLHHGQQRWFPL